MIIEKVINNILGIKKTLKQRKIINRNLNEYIKEDFINYKYWSGGLILYLKTNVIKSLRLGLLVKRQNFKTGLIEKFNYYEEKFEVI